MPRRNSNSKHAQRQAKGKMDGDSRNRGWEASLKAKAYRQRERRPKEPGSRNQVPQTTVSFAHYTSATPIKRSLSLLKSGKLKASWKKAKGKLKASERQAKSELKGS